MSKWFMNNHHELVQEALLNLVSTNSDLMRLPGTQVIALKELGSNQVGLICGGGSGHEPAHAGFVNQRILSASVNGNIFASPPYQHILSAIKHISALNNNSGVLLIIKNYTGDILNFNLAKQSAQFLGIRVESLVVGDDIAFVHDLHCHPELLEQRRGLAGTVLLYKIIGAGSAELLSFDKIRALSKQVNENLYTMGVSLSTCSLPGSSSNQQFEENTMEVGLGIHGEKGLQRLPLESSRDIVKRILSLFQRFIQPSDEVVVLLNNLGSTTPLEISQLSVDILREAQNLKWVIRVLISGMAMSSLDMHGVSITVLKLSGLEDKDLVQAYLTQQNSCSAWQGLSVSIDPKLVQESELVYQQSLQPLKNPIPSNISNKIKFLCHALIEQESYLNECDGKVGDGDLGQSVAAGSRALIQLLQQEVTLGMVAETVAESMGGSSGPLISSFIFGLEEGVDGKWDSEEGWFQGLSIGTLSMKKLGGAQVGDRTMIDVLEPITKTQLPLREIAELVEQQSLQVRELRARKGRSRYLVGKEIGLPEPGCELLNIVFKLLNQ